MRVRKVGKDLSSILILVFHPPTRNFFLAFKGSLHGMTLVCSLEIWTSRWTSRWTTGGTSGSTLKSLFLGIKTSKTDLGWVG